MRNTITLIFIRALYPRMLFTRSTRMRVLFGASLTLLLLAAFGGLYWLFELAIRQIVGMPYSALLSGVVALAYLWVILIAIKHGVRHG